MLQFSISDESNEFPDFPELSVGYGSSKADDDVDLLSSSIFSSFFNKFSSDVQMVEVDSLSHFFRLVCVDIDRFSRFDGSLIFSTLWMGRSAVPTVLVLSLFTISLLDVPSNWNDCSAMHVCIGTI